MDNIWEDFDFPTLDVTKVSSAGSNNKMHNSTIVQKESLSQDNMGQYGCIMQDTTSENTANENAEYKNTTDENIIDENITYEDINWDDFPTF